METVNILHSKLVELGFTPPTLTGDYTRSATELNAYFHQLVVPSLNKGFPKGSWYLVTITTPVGSSRADLFQVHTKFVDYIAGKAIVQHGVIEKSSIWHCHYMINLQQSHAKNLQRDLRKACGVLVDIQRKVTSLQRFNGLCKYITKREYDTEKADTHVATIINGVTHKAGHGYILNPTPIVNDFFSDEPSISPPSGASIKITMKNTI